MTIYVRNLFVDNPPGIVRGLRDMKKMLFILLVFSTVAGCFTNDKTECEEGIEDQMNSLVPVMAVNCNGDAALLPVCEKGTLLYLSLQNSAVGDDCARMHNFWFFNL